MYQLRQTGCASYMIEPGMPSILPSHGTTVTYNQRLATDGKYTVNCGSSSVD